MQLEFLLVYAGIWAFSSCVGDVSAVQMRPGPPIAGSSPANDPIEPVILKFDLSKEGVLVRLCYGAHIDIPELNRINWIMPAECLDKTKFDMIAVNCGYKETRDAKFYLKNLKVHIHPSDNIAVVVLPRWPYMDPKTGYRHIQLPLPSDNFNDKILKIYEYVNITTNIDNQENMFLFSVKMKLVNSKWCTVLYPLSTNKKYQICASGWFDEGLSKDNFGAPLISREGDTFKLVGLATTTRSQDLIIQIISIQPYLDWIIQVGHLDYNKAV